MQRAVGENQYRCKSMLTERNEQVGSSKVNLKPLTNTRTTRWLCSHLTTNFEIQPIELVSTTSSQFVRSSAEHSRLSNSCVSQARSFRKMTKLRNRRSLKPTKQRTGLILRQSNLSTFLWMKSDDRSKTESIRWLKHKHLLSKRSRVNHSWAGHTSLSEWDSSPSSAISYRSTSFRNKRTSSWSGRVTLKPNWRDWVTPSSRTTVNSY